MFLLKKKFIYPTRQNLLYANVSHHMHHLSLFLFIFWFFTSNIREIQFYFVSKRVSCVNAQQTHIYSQTYMVEIYAETMLFCGKKIIQIYHIIMNDSLEYSL